MSVVDTGLAANVAARLVSPGPSLSLTDAADVVIMLRDLTDEAEAHVREVTGLHGRVGPATVVDRAAWAEANAQGFDNVLAPLTEVLTRKQSRLTIATTAKVTGVQVGSLLAWLSSKVLGQYEAFQPEGQEGRLLLVAPNIVETERKLGVDPHDFRLWVALHEVTHRTQFTAVPWLHGHVREEVQNLLKASKLDDPEALIARLKQVMSHPHRGSLVEMIATTEQREVMDRVTGFMSLLEGHAEHVMDGVGPSVVPSVQHIRDRFEQRRRDKGGPFERLLRRLLGMDMKALQYSQGRAFVGHVVDELGMAGFNRIWTGPETLPSKAEITDPDAWIKRTA
jgi:coenzyme F420 biosynthesis associated uncharacterized protein